MTTAEKDLLDGIVEMAERAPSLGLCAAPYRILHTQVWEIIKERDELLKYRAPAKVLQNNGWSGKCPSCGAIFLDDLTNYCGNCGQRIAFEPRPG